MCNSSSCPLHLSHVTHSASDSQNLNLAPTARSLGPQVYVRVVIYIVSTVHVRVVIHCKYGTRTGTL